MVRSDVSPSSVLTADIVKVGQSRPVRAKTAGQRRYVDAIAEHVITFALGPAGTGKSWLAVAMAVQAL
ncbi:MAG: PhoH family protein, partial [Actinomycetota bacterium]